MYNHLTIAVGPYSDKVYIVDKKALPHLLTSRRAMLPHETFIQTIIDYTNNHLQGTGDTITLQLGGISVAKIQLLPPVIQKP